MTELEWKNTMHDMFCKQSGEVYPTEEMKQRIDSILEKERNMKNIHNHKKVYRKKTVVLAAALCLFLFCSAFAFAAGKLSGLVSTSGSGFSSESFSDLEKAEKKLGYSVDAADQFTNGYTFRKMSVDATKGIDEQGAEIGRYNELSIEYEGSGAAVSFHVSKPFPETVAEIGKGAKDTVVRDGMTFYYSSDTYKFVPDGYELTPEDETNMKRDDYFLSYGASQTEINQVSYVNWYKDGICYSLMTFDWEGGKDELYTMAYEIAF